MAANSPSLAGVCAWGGLGQAGQPVYPLCPAKSIPKDDRNTSAQGICKRKVFLLPIPLVGLGKRKECIVLYNSTLVTQNLQKFIQMSKAGSRISWTSSWWRRAHSLDPGKQESAMLCVPRGSFIFQFLSTHEANFPASLGARVGSCDSF